MSCVKSLASSLPLLLGNIWGSPSKLVPPLRTLASLLIVFRFVSLEGKLISCHLLVDWFLPKLSLPPSRITSCSVWPFPLISLIALTSSVEIFFGALQIGRRKSIWLAGRKSQSPKGKVVWAFKQQSKNLSLVSQTELESVL